MLEKAYVRFRESLPDSSNTYAAADGFVTQGIPIVPFYGFDDVKEIKDLSPATIVCGMIGDTWNALQKLGRPIPQSLDYPDHLHWMMGRDFAFVTLEHVRGLVTQKFVKPVKQKLFSGFVYDSLNPKCRLQLAPYDDEVPCIISEPVEFVSEYRCFVMNDIVVGIKHYKGDQFVALNRPTFEKAVRCCKGKMPAAYALDLGVTASGETLLVEVNDGYALGSYGLASVIYSRLLEARWEELTK